MRNLRSEKEIMAQWLGDPSKPLVSICCTAYNHEPYIEDALEGFLIQETDFPFEILIHDDASTDRTADIIREYEARYPKLIKPIYQTENQYSQGNKPGYINSKRAVGEYIAFCEGDDYWINSLKLKKQLNMMKSTDTNMVVHPSILINMSSAKHSAKPFGWHGDTDKLINGKKIFYQIGQFSPTSSYFVKKTKADEYRSFMKTVRPTFGDFFLEAICSDKPFFYISDYMSVYRRNHKNSHSYKNFNKPNAEKINDYFRNAKATKSLLKYPWINKKDIDTRLSYIKVDTLSNLFRSSGFGEIKILLNDVFFDYELNQYKILSLFHSYSNISLYILLSLLTKIKKYGQANFNNNPLNDCRFKNLINREKGTL